MTQYTYNTRSKCNKCLVFLISNRNSQYILKMSSIWINAHIDTLGHGFSHHMTDPGAVVMGFDMYTKKLLVKCVFTVNDSWKRWGF